MIAYMMKDMITTSVLRFIHFTQEMTDGFQEWK